jgi:sn-glycerol 3-phosphate transport system ATP-binding protein
MAEIEFLNVCKDYGSVKVIENLNLKIADGTFTVLVGASGCGKTTLLRALAGIGPATSGKIIVGGEDITNIPPARRNIAMVFQNYAIYPTMTVKGNIEFGLKNNKVPKAERERLIKEVCDTVGLTQFLDRKPGTLSGGQRQRVALARAMVKKPKVFLMDEPLSNLDAKLRGAMRVELIELHKRLKATFIYVTHDQVEAMSMADTIVLMNNGKIQQEGAPHEIYNDPNNVFTAQFIGTPPMNLIALEDGTQMGFRPEKCVISKEARKVLYTSEGTVKVREMLGSETLYKVEGRNGYVNIKSTDSGFNFDEYVHISVEEENLYFFDKEGERIRHAPGAARDNLYSMAGRL